MKEYEECGNKMANGLYPYTVVACQFGKRIYREYATYEHALDAIEDACDSMHWSAKIIITPNQTVLKRSNTTDNGWEKVV